MTNPDSIAGTVRGIYEWLYVQQTPGTDCQACGKCCDFERFGHRLYLTTPELVFFENQIPVSRLLPMETDVCPYRIDGKCSVYEERFAGCRIFMCKGDEQLQSMLSEAAIEQFKLLCREHNLPYEYMDLKTALNRLYRRHLG